VNYVCEIPYGTTAKYEISTTGALNPIEFDRTKDGRPRHYALSSVVNYGALPRTFEDPDRADEWTGLRGDGDPVDLCEISSSFGSMLRKPHIGGVYTVKVLGALALVDGGETDWKVIAIKADDPLAQVLDDLGDIFGSSGGQLSGSGNALAKKGKIADADTLCRVLEGVREWYRCYKIPEGKGENGFGFDGAFQNKKTALDVIESTNHQWQELVFRTLQTEASQSASLVGRKAVLASTKKGPWISDTVRNVLL
jgi:inorganic pyrophosphatase